MFWGAWKYVLPDSLKAEIPLFGIFVYSGVLLFVVYIIAGFVSAAKNTDKDIKITNFFVALVLLVWLWDLAPPELNLGIFKIPIPGGGIYYQGFIWNISGDFFTSIPAILASSVMFAFIYINMVYNIVEKDYIVAALGFGFILLSNKLASYIPTQYNYSIPIPWGNTAFLITVLIGFLITIFLISMYRKHGITSKIPNFFSFLFMAFVFSFFWINNGWRFNVKAIAHAAYIVIFGFFYITRMESKNPSVWHFMIPLLLIADFYGYGFLFGSDILVLKFFPILVLFVVAYCYHKTKSLYALTTTVVIVTIILILSLQASGYESSTVSFTPREGGADFKNFMGSLFGKAQDAIISQLDYATGGYYRGSVEKNQFEPLGVFFDRIKPAQPRFYTDEPVTVWATIKSRTLSDPVFVNFTCFRTGKDGKRTEANKNDHNAEIRDTVIPEKPFTVYTLEEKDTECTFNKNKFQAGGNSIFLSATYTFLTSAYQKFYLMDDERYRAMYRENLDPLKEFGITDRTPLAIATNGPVEIGVGINYLTPVSAKMSVDPALFITLTNREKINDKQGKPYGEWTGKIKQINELAVVLPKGATIEPGQCTPIKFKPFSRQDCSSSCMGVCAKTCGEFEDGSEDKKGCIDACDLSKPKTKACEEDCNNLFKSETGASDYQGFQLSVEEIKTKDAYKDIDRFLTFSCRLKFDKNTVLENTPITTKFIRIRARYDYLLEKQTSVNIETVPAVEETKAPEFGTRISDQKYLEVYLDRNNPNEVEYSRVILKIAKDPQYNVDYLLVKAMIQKESSWNPNAVRHEPSKGDSSYGFMQLLSSTAKSQNCKNDWNTNPESNIECGIKYIRYLMNYQKSNNLKEGIKNIIGGYNGGEGAMRYSKDPGHETETVWENKNNAGYEITRQHVNKVMEYYNAMVSQLKTENPSPPAQQSQTPTISNAVASYDSIGKKVVIKWDKSPNPAVVKYLVTRLSQGSSQDSYETVENIYNDVNFLHGKEYYYFIWAIDSNNNIQASAETPKIVIPTS